MLVLLTLVLLLFFLLFFGLTLPVRAESRGEAVLQGVRVHNAPNYTRLVMDTTEELEFRLGGSEQKAFIALNNLSPESAFDFDNVNLAGSRIVSLTLERGRGARAKLRLPTSMPLHAKAFRLDPIAPYGHRLVVDLFVDQKPAESAATIHNDGDGDLRDIVVALDSGHGGEDPGALGAGGVHEADVVMTLSRKVANLLNKQPGLRVLLVRDGDYYVRRLERKNIARDARADLFVSLHADAYIEADVQGASVYALSPSGASSEVAAWLAAKDSRSDLIGGVIGGVVSDVSLRETDADLARVLLDLSMDAQRNASLQLADELLTELARSVEMHKYTVEEAGFEVLKSPDIPSVLIETGFLSNPEEARRLSDSRYQDQVAGAVARGILNYVLLHPPPGSLIAQRSSKPKSGADDSGRSRLRGKDGLRRHIIRSGDSLSEVAALYGVSTKALRAANSLANDRIKIGQVLRIPLP